MVRHAEFGANTFMGTPAEAEAHVSSPTAQGYFAIFAWFDYEEGGGAVFELRLHMQAGIQDVLRRGPSLTALAHEGPGLLQERLRHAEREGVRFCPCSVLDAALLVRETLALLPAAEQSALELKPWFLGYKAFLLSVHCHMVKHPDARYFDETAQLALGIWDTGATGLGTRPSGTGSPPPLSKSEIAALAVQSPYILMLPRRGASRSVSTPIHQPHGLIALKDSSRTRGWTPDKDGSFARRQPQAEDELPECVLLLRIAQYLAWWRRARAAAGDARKAELNCALAAALSRADATAQVAVRQQLLDAVLHTNSTKIGSGLRDYVQRTGTDGFLKNWSSGDQKEMTVSNGVIEAALIPHWMQVLMDKEAVRKKILTPRPGTSVASLGGTTPSSSLSSISGKGSPRTPRVRFANIAMTPPLSLDLPTSTTSTPRRLGCHPWTTEEETKAVILTPRDVNHELGREWPKANRMLVPASDLNAHIEWSGYQYPEFEASYKGLSRNTYDFHRDARYHDAAGLAQKGAGRTVIASQPGVFARSYLRLNQKREEIFGPMDMWVAEDFHRQAVATTQQLYLRPEFRVGTSAPVHYMDAIRRDRIRAV